MIDFINTPYKTKMQSVIKYHKYSFEIASDVNSDIIIDYFENNIYALALSLNESSENLWPWIILY
jgi:hypothetical protein